MIKNFFIDMGYGSSLREKRESAKLSQDKLADLVTARGHKISGAYISMIEREYDKTASGEPTRVNRDFVVKAAEVLSWDVSDALREADYYAPTDEDNEILRLFSKIPKDARKAAERAVEALIAEPRTGRVRF